MADDGRARPVSGEIMAGPKDAAGPGGPRAAADDIVDAQYETVAGSAPRTERPAEPSIGSTAAPAGGMDMLRRPLDRPLARPARGGPLFWIFGVGLAAAAFWISGGHALIRELPFAMQRAPQSALRISSVASRVDASGARAVLFVDGEAANDGMATEKLPPLEIAVAGNDGTITRYRLGTNGRELAPGETFAFSSRLDVPKNGVKTVTVGFSE